MMTNDGVACKLADAKKYWTSNRHDAVKIRFSGPEGALSSSQPISVPEFYLRSVDKYSNRTALKVERDGKWISWTFKKCLEEIRTIAKAFIKV